MPDCLPLSVAVLLELDRGPASGGHVKCWEQFARVAAGVPEVDLTVYVLGRRPRVDVVADNVRFMALPSVLGTGVFHKLVGGVDASDLAPYHPALASRLPRHDLWHLTHTLAFAATALRVVGRHPRPLVASVHTDVPRLTAMYTRQVVDGLPSLLRAGIRRTPLPALATTLARRRRDRVLRACDRVLVSNADDRAEVAAAVPGARLSLLRRGVDPSLFHPRHADRQWLADRYGVPQHPPLVLFVGRVDVTKGAYLLAEAVCRVRASGVDAHLVLAGSGADTGRIARLLGDGVSVLGHVPQADLARVYASCDVMAFPSRSETAGNVVAEAMAAGLPVVLPRGASTVQWLAAPGQDGLLVDRDDPDAWARALGTLLSDADRRAMMGRRARATSDSVHPSWADVLREDLLPVWHDTAAGWARRRPGRRPDANRTGVRTDRTGGGYAPSSPTCSEPCPPERCSCSSCSWS